MSGRGTYARYLPAALISAAFVPLILLFSVNLWSRPHYQFFPLVVPGAAALAWHWSRYLGPLKPGSSVVGLAAAAMGWLLLFVGIAFVTPWFGAVGALVALFGAIFAAGGWPLARASLPAWGFLWLAIPPPRRYDYVLISGLQNVVSQWSSELLDLAKVYHLMNGNVVQIAGRNLLVDQACSGIYSLFTLLVGTLFYVLWVRSSVPRALLLVVASVFWVLFGNVLRILTVVFLSAKWNIDAVTGWKHELLGLVIFGMMIGLVLSTDRLFSVVAAIASETLAVFSHPARSRSLESRSRPDQLRGSLVFAGSRSRSKANAGSNANPEGSKPTTTGLEELPADLPRADDSTRTVLTPIAQTWMSSLPVAVAFGLLLLPQAVMPGVHWKEVFTNGGVFEKAFASLDADAMPGRIALGVSRGSDAKASDGKATAAPTLRTFFQRLNYNFAEREWDNSWGRFSRTWQYLGPGYYAEASLDYHFVSWHPLTDCYRSQGWNLTSMRFEPLPTLPTQDGPKGGDEPGAMHMAAAEMRNADGSFGYLVFGLFDRRGRPVEPPGSVGTLELLRGRLLSWVRSDIPSGRYGEVMTYQLQVFARSEMPLPPEDRRAIQGLLALEREQVERLGIRTGGRKSP